MAVVWECGWNLAGEFHALWGQQPDSVESSELLLAIKM